MTYHQNNIEDFKNTARFFEEDTREEIYKNNLANIYIIWIEMSIWKFDLAHWQETLVITITIH